MSTLLITLDVGVLSCDIADLTVTVDVGLSRLDAKADWEVTVDVGLSCFDRVDFGVTLRDLVVFIC